MQFLKLLILFLFWTSLGCGKRQEVNLPKAVNGVMDLTDWEFSKTSEQKNSKIINLDGQWEFYWKKFLEPNDFRELEKNNFLEKDFIQVPMSWNGHNVAPKTSPPELIEGDGYATYRLKLITREVSGLSLQLPTMGTAYKFFINGNLVAQVGKIGTTQEESKPDYKVQIIGLPKLSSGEYEFIFQISNFNYKQGGIWYPIPIGLDEDIIKEREKNLFVDFFLSGSLLIMGLYHLGLFSIKRKDSSTLWFGLTCLLIAIRTLLTGEFYFYTLFPYFPFELGVKLEYAAFYLGVPFFILFLKEVFPKDSPQIPVLTIQYSSYILLIPVIIFPTRVFTHFVLIMEGVAIFAILLGLYVMIKSVIKKREGAKSFLAGSFLLTITLLNDILHTNLIIYTGFYAPAGFFIFVFSQAFLLSVRFAKAFTQVEELSANLEQKVIERTKQLEEAMKLAESEHKKSEKLLLNILPIEVAAELKEKGLVTPVLYESTTIMFTDFKGFTQIAEGLSPQDLVKELDSCFTQFDKITERFHLEKLKTIGDSYMCAGGIPKTNRTHAIDSCLAALEIQDFMNKMKTSKQKLNVPYWELRLGIHSGAIIAGVVGEKKFAYDVWGDTVNTASRMESSGTPGRINISYATYELIKDFFNCEYRGEIDAKNKGKVKMYYLTCIKKDFSADQDGLTPNEKFLTRLREIS